MPNRKKAGKTAGKNPEKKGFLSLFTKGKTPPSTAQQTLPYREMYRDGVCRVADRYYTKTIRFLYKGIIIKHNKTEPTYTKTSLFLCEKRRFFMARTEKGVVATI